MDIERALATLESKMKGFGILLMLAGAAVTLLSFGLDVSVASSASISGFGSGAIVNIGKLQNQMMIFHLGLGIFLAGTIMMATGTLLKFIEPDSASVTINENAPSKTGGFDPLDHI